MSLDISKLENVRACGGKTIARCPACAEAGGDRTGDHLVIRANGRFGCVVYPGDSADAKEHRRRIFALCGDREIKPLSVHAVGVGRPGRVNQSQSAGQPLKTGLLGRLGRVFETHLEGERQPTADKEHTAVRQLNNCEKGVLGVPSQPPAPLERPLTEDEHELLMGWSGIDLILEARKLFNATIVGIGSADEKLHVGPDWVQMSLLEELQDGFRQSR
jgi:hypothetical protein